MTMHDERWTLGVAENGDVRLRDLKTGETWRYGGQYALTDAIGRLADWRESVPDKGDYGATDEIPKCTCGEPSGLSGCEQHMPEPLRADTQCERIAHA